MKIRTRLVCLMLILFIAFLSVFFIQRQYNHDRLVELFHSVQKEQEVVFDKIMGLYGKTLQMFSYDYSFWDEMVDFVQSGDKKWASENIEVSLDTYQASASWVYNLDSKLVYSVNNLEDSELKYLPVPPEQIPVLFADSPFAYFFINSSQGLIEVYGASIHPTSDPERKSQPMGFLFCGRLWDQGYIDELSRVSDTKLFLSDSPREVVKTDPESINFDRDLKSWDGKPLKYLIVSLTSSAVTAAKKTADQVAALFAFFCVAVLGGVSLFLFLWINLPLRLIGLGLSKGDAKPLEKLKKQNSEFAEISRLIERFFRQKEEMVKESAQRKLVLDALHKVNQCFSSFEINPDKNIQLMTDATGEVLGATCVLYNCRKDDDLVTCAGWHLPDDYTRVSAGQGHICFDLINDQANELVVIKDLASSKYAQSDPNVKKYNLQSYISYPVRVKGRTTGTLCAVFDHPAKIEDYHLNLLRVLGRTLSIEEERRQMDEVLRNQARDLDEALKEALGSREILLSMLEDNQLNKLKLESSLQELALAYSKLEKSQEEVIQSAKFGAIGQLASSVAHEVRNPLAIIMQSIEYLENKVPAAHREIIQVAANNIKRANTIVGTLLDFSKAKKLDKELQDINEVVGDALKLTHFSNLKDKITVLREMDNQLPRVLVDRQKMEQVFVNIILNAMQAMPAGGNFIVRTYLLAADKLKAEVRSALPQEQLRAAVVVEVQDEGVGISEESMKDIFRPFFTTKGAMTGIGLGLSVVKDIIEMHKAHIEITSRVDRGTNVYIYLPVT